MVDDGRTTDDGRTPDHGHPISSPCEPDGSGELKRRIKAVARNTHRVCICFNDPRMTFQMMVLCHMIGVSMPNKPQ